jgi:anti-anti-sigma regulatory factor
MDYASGLQMLRITRIDESSQRTTLRLEGRITARELAEVRAACEACAREGRALSLDVSGVRFLDSAAASALRALGRSALRLEGASPFVRLLLEEVPS